MQMLCNFFFRFSDSLLECALIWAGGQLSYLRCSGKMIAMFVLVCFGLCVNHSERTGLKYWYLKSRCHL
jgi:hypothetical protein